MKTRLRELDFVRAIMVLSVIAIHVTGRYLYISPFSFSLNQMMRYAVPLFIMLSGLALFLSDMRKDKTSYLTFLKKRFNKIFIPYILWTIIYMLFDLRRSLPGAFFNYETLKLFYRNLVFGGASYHLYFIIIIVQLYLLYPFLSWVIKKSPKITLISTFLITLLFQTAIYFSILGKVVLPYFPIPYFMTFPVWIFFFVFGMYFAKEMDFFKAKLKNKDAVLGALWLVTLVIVIVDSKLTNTADSSIRPSVMLYCFTSFFFIYTLCERFSDKKTLFGNFLEFLSAQSFFIYLGHVLVLNLIFSILYKIGWGFLAEQAVGILPVYLATVFITIGIALILRYIPYNQHLGTGYKKINKNSIVIIKH